MWPKLALPFLCGFTYVSLIFLCLLYRCVSIIFLAYVLLSGINVCKLDPEAGPCETFVPAYFYNATSQMCERFTYGGCHGNGNKFFTITECQRACGKSKCNVILLSNLFKRQGGTKSIPYSLNISREKISAGFAVLRVISENFSLEIFRPHML